MIRTLIAIFACVMALGLAANEAEAARMGGGKSVGMQRQAVSPRPAQQAAPATPAQPAAAPAAAPKRNWMGPIAGLAAGLGIAALLSHFGLGEGMANFLMIALLVMAAVFVVRLLMRKKAPPADASPLQYAGGVPNDKTEPAQRAFSAQFPASSGSAAAPETARVPAGFDSEGFVRVAKLNFLRLQAANDAGNVDDIREFTSPELFAEIRLQMHERGATPQQTEVVTLNAELVEVLSEDKGHVASVLFSGMIREQADAAAVPFSEVWHLTKPAVGGQGWVVAGIQQAN